MILEETLVSAASSTPSLDVSYNVPQGLAMNKSAGHYARVSGPNLLARTEQYAKWRQARIEAEVWPYSRCLASAPGARAIVRNEAGKTFEGINFASQDYLGLSSHPAIIEAAMNALQEYGPHSASSPMLQGNTDLSLHLEDSLAALLQTEHVALFSTGWGAGFGAIVGLVRPDDHIIMDNLAHACLQQGAQAATANIRRHNHLDIEAVRQHLVEIRSTDIRNAILVITEGLFSMDSDMPDIMAMQTLCHEYGATLLVDVAHDLGDIGPGGTGALGLQEMLGKVDLVVGAFSKTFASNGGFLATHHASVKNYVKTFGGPAHLSNALSPVQAAVVTKAIEIVRSREGSLLRERLMQNVCQLRGEFQKHGIRCIGSPSAIVPVSIGSEKVARLASALLFDRHVFANLVEFPAVAIGASRFRMQVMSSHTPEQISLAAGEVMAAIADADRLVFADAPAYAVVAS